MVEVQTHLASIIAATVGPISPGAPRTTAQSGAAEFRARDNPRAAFVQGGIASVSTEDIAAGRITLEGQEKDIAARLESAEAMGARMERLVQDLVDKATKAKGGGGVGGGSGGGGGGSGGGGGNPTPGGGKRKQNQISAEACYHHIHKGKCNEVSCPFDHSLPAAVVMCPKLATCKRGLACFYSH